MYINSTDVSDFQYVNKSSPPGSLSLSPNTTQQCVNIDILDDSEMEETEFLTLSLSLTSEQNSIALSQPNATVYIIDNDSELCRTEDFTQSMLLCVPIGMFNVSIYVYIYISLQHSYLPCCSLILGLDGVEWSNRIR